MAARGCDRFIAVSTNIYSEMREVPEQLATPERALALGAHPDDIEFGCGGTLAAWAAAGCHVTLAIATDGSKGSWDPNVDPAELAALRAAEQEAAAAQLGADSVVHLNYVDGELLYDMELRERVCELIRRARPDVFLSHDPWQRYQVHPDHRATGWGAVDGMVAARDPLFFPEQEVPPHRPAAMLLWSADQPDYWHDISGFVATKTAALLCHSSQGETTMGNAQDGGAAAVQFAERITKWATRQGAAAGLDAAEAFKRLTP